MYAHTNPILIYSLLKVACVKPHSEERSLKRCKMFKQTVKSPKVGVSVYRANSIFSREVFLAGNNVENVEDRLVLRTSWYAGFVPACIWCLVESFLNNGTVAVMMRWILKSVLCRKCILFTITHVNILFNLKPTLTIIST